MERLSRRFICVLLVGMLCPVMTTRAEEEAGTWAFAPREDSFEQGALLDLRWLNEDASGERGFVRLSEDGNSFVRGDGEPIRFWAVGSEVYKPPTKTKRETEEEYQQRRTQWKQDIPRHFRFLAKQGVNMARLHTTVADTREGAAIDDVNEETIEGIFRFIAAAKENGIYVTISPYYPNHNTPKSWRLEGYGPEQKPWGAIFVDPRLQAAYKTWTRELYTRKNPHTGLAIKDDPTVAILQILNEDSMFFWTMQRLPEPLARRLGDRLADWLVKKYGALEKAQAAWDGQQQKEDDFAAGHVHLLSTWHMTRDWEGGTALRLADQTEFLARWQRAFYAEMGRYLREELGCRQLLNATNWRTADDLKLKEIERWTYAALDMDAENEYYGSDYQHRGENDGYRIDPGHLLVNESCLHKPLELTVNFKQQVGHPFIVTETSWKHPNLYQTEGPFLISAYQSLGGVDIVYWFTATTPTWNLDPRRLFWPVGESHALGKWSCSTPMLMGMFPAGALVYRRGYLKPGETIVHEERSLESLWRREPPLIDDNEIYGVSRETEECKSIRREDGRISRAAFLVGRVETKLGGDSDETNVKDFSRYLKADDRSIHSSSGELVWDYGDGMCRMDAPRAQGVTGFLKQAGGRFELSDVAITSENDYATISVVSMDDRPLAESTKILVQVGTTARLTGWETEEATFKFREQQIRGERIVNAGRPPWRIADTKVTLRVNNPRLTKATLLDAGGYAADGVPVARDDRGVTLELPASTMYLVLE